MQLEIFDTSPPVSKAQVKKVLRLTLQKLPFEVMATGEKAKEYRNGSPWMRSRLYDRDGSPRNYDLIEFRNGYGKDAPAFVCEWGGFMELTADLDPVTFSNGLRVAGLGKGDFVINCGAVVSRSNIRQAPPVAGGLQTVTV